MFEWIYAQKTDKNIIIGSSHESNLCVYCKDSVATFCSGDSEPKKIAATIDSMNYKEMKNAFYSILEQKIHLDIDCFNDVAGMLSAEKITIEGFLEHLRESKSCLCQS